jgi:CO/xanthine dehydrogenase FAD-binding subunit
MELADPLLALAEASRTVGGPQIRNRGTLGGNLGTASPAGDALPPLLAYGAQVELASTRGSRVVPLQEFLVGPKRNALQPDELIAAVRLVVPGPRQTFMKVGPRNAMVIAVVSLALVVDGDELRASYGSAGPVPGPRHGAGRRTATLFPSRWPRRRARSTTCAARLATGGTPCAC